MEFNLFRFEPEPWNLKNYLAILKVANWGLSAAAVPSLAAVTIR
jgi:acyl-homoserine lactone acylase PvdQ